jgi:CheY-like chemotaxis protein
MEDAPRRRVLVIDDDAAVRSIIAETLRGEGYRVDEAGSGAEGLERLRAEPPDLILLDVQMPGMNGIGFVDQLHQEAGTTDIPIVILTATPELPESAQEHGIKAVLTKPFDIGLLTAMVERLVRASDTDNPPSAARGK